MDEFFEKRLSDLITGFVVKLLLSKFGIIIGGILLVVVGFFCFSHWVFFLLGKVSRK